MSQWVKDQVKQRGLSSSVHLLGSYSIEKMPIYFALADAMLVTLRDDLIFSLTIPAKVQSYLACGKPIVAALNGEGAKVIKESGSGFVVESGDYKGLSEIIVKMYQTSIEDRQKMGDNGRTYFENNFEREILLDKLENWLIELV